MNWVPDKIISFKLLNNLFSATIETDFYLSLLPSKIAKPWTPSLSISATFLHHIEL